MSKERRCHKCHTLEDSQTVEPFHQVVCDNGKGLGVFYYCSDCWMDIEFHAKRFVMANGGLRHMIVSRFVTKEDVARWEERGQTR